MVKPERWRKVDQLFQAALERAPSERATFLRDAYTGRWLDKAVEERSYWLCWLKVDPRLDGLRTDLRFRD